MADNALISDIAIENTISSSEFGLLVGPITDAIYVGVHNAKVKFEYAYDA